MNAPKPKTTNQPKPFFSYTDYGHNKAKQFLDSIGKLDKIPQESISTNGYNLIKEANFFHKQLASKEFRNYKTLVLFEAVLIMDRDFSQEEKELCKINDQLFKIGFIDKRPHAVIARELIKTLNQQYD